MKTTKSFPGIQTSKAGAVAQVGALLSAILASACCWLPLLFIAFGVSGGTLAVRFEAFRPVLLPLTFALLSLAFYLTYRRPRAVATGSKGEESCGCPPERSKGFAIKKLNKIMLWVVTAFVLAFAFFPNYVGFVLGAGESTSTPPRTEQIEWVLVIEGMTCQGCAAHLQSELRKISGVAEAEVDYEQGTAVVVATPDVTESKLKRAVEAAGYSVSSAENTSRKQGDLQ
jgi:copper chaperone CopZ